MLLEEDSAVIFDNYFDICTPNSSCLVSLPTKDKDNEYHVVEDRYVTLPDGSQVVYFHGKETDLLSILENQPSESILSFKDFLEYGSYSFPQSAALLPLLALGGGGGGEVLRLLMVIP